MAEHTAFPLIQRLRTTLTSRPPYCSGVLEVAPDNFELYYGREDAQYVASSIQRLRGSAGAIVRTEVHVQLC